MRKLYAVLLITLIGYQGIGQETKGAQGDKKETKGQKTKVVVLDVGPPNEDSFVIYDCEKPLKLGTVDDSCKKNKKKLRINSNHLLSFQIINANPYKYSYKLNNKKRSFFEDNTNTFETEINKLKNAKTSTVQQDTSEPKLNGDANAMSVKTLSENAEMATVVLSDVTNEIQSKMNMSSDEKHGISTSSFRVEFSEIELKLKKLDSIINKQKNLISKIERQKVKFQIANRKQKNTIAILVKKNDSLIKELTQKITYETARLELLAAIKAINTIKTELDIDMMYIRNEDYISRDSIIAIRKIYKPMVDKINLDLNIYTLSLEDKLKKENVEKYNKLLTDSYTPIYKIVTKELERVFSLKLDHYTEPREFDGDNIDVIELSLERTPKKDSDAEKTNLSTYKIWVTGGFKIDVSAGVFFSSLVNREYEIFDAPNESDGQTDPMDPMTMGEEENSKVINELNTGRYEYGFGTVANITYRMGTWVKPTLNFGVMLTTEQRFQFLLGGGVILGKMDRFVFHTGISIGRISTINDRLVADGTTPYEADQLPQNLNVEELKIGHFFGVTYNLGKTNRETTN